MRTTHRIAGKLDGPRRIPQAKFPNANSVDVPCDRCAVRRRRRQTHWATSDGYQPAFRCCRGRRNTSQRASEPAVAAIRFVYFFCDIVCLSVKPNKVLLDWNPKRLRFVFHSCFAWKQTTIDFSEKSSKKSAPEFETVTQSTYRKRTSRKQTVVVRRKPEISMPVRDGLERFVQRGNAANQPVRSTCCQRSLLRWTEKWRFAKWLGTLFTNRCSSSPTWRFACRPFSKERNDRGEFRLEWKSDSVSGNFWKAKSAFWHDSASRVSCDDPFFGRLNYVSSGDCRCESDF